MLSPLPTQPLIQLSCWRAILLAMSSAHGRLVRLSCYARLLSFVAWIVLVQPCFSQPAGALPRRPVLGPTANSQEGATEPFKSAAAPALNQVGANSQRAEGAPQATWQLTDPAPPMLSAESPAAENAAIDSRLVPAASEMAPMPGFLRLADVEALALSNNPSIAQATALVRAAKGNQIQVGLNPNPNVGYEGQQIGSGGLAEQHGVVVSQEVVLGGKLWRNRLVAQQEVYGARQQLSSQRQRVLTDARLAFYQVLVAQQRLAVAENLVRLAAQSKTAAEALLAAKEVSRADVLQATLEVENTRLVLQNARNRLDASWRELSAVIGVPCLNKQTVIEEPITGLKCFEYEAILAHLQRCSPEIARARTEIRRAQAALDRARVQKIPNLNLVGGINVIDNGIGGRPDATVGISSPLPVFDRNQGGVMQARSQLTAANRALAVLELDLRSRLARVFERYENARNQVASYQNEILPTAGESLDLSRKLYESGQEGYLVYLNSQRNYAQMNLAYWDALGELRSTEVEMEGMLLSGSLQATLAP